MTDAARQAGQQVAVAAALSPDLGHPAFASIATAADI